MRVSGCVVLSLGLLLTSLAGAQTTYKWVDPVTKRTVFSDQPPPPGTRNVSTQETKQAPADSLPYATKIAVEKYPVTLFTTVNCTEACASARGFLRTRGIPFSERVIKTPSELAELSKEQGAEPRFPALKVGTQPSIVGFEAGGWGNLLDLAGYPKSVAPNTATQATAPTTPQ